jgi:hypothetical protein
MVTYDLDQDYDDRCSVASNTLFLGNMDCRERGCRFRRTESSKLSFTRLVAQGT